MDMKDLEDVAHRYKKATDALDVVRTEMQGTAVALLQQDGVKQADVARITGWSREHLRRLREKAETEAQKAEVEALRRKVEELSATAPPPTTRSTGPRPAAAPKQQHPRPKPEPQVDGRPLSDEEAAILAALARSRATEMQLKKLEQNTSMVGDSLKDFTTVQTAMDMELLTHDEVYGPSRSEEPTT